jgi:hypothetical protein
LLFHYHIFKNAGTSIDEILRRTFGSQWVKREFPIRSNALAVAEFLGQQTNLLAVSSHTALLPSPRVNGLKVIPIIFIRHPIDRLRSAYDFERKQIANTAGARLAKKTSLAGYVRELLRTRGRQARSFQTFRLSHNSPPLGTERQRAIQAISELPFIGLVEAFDSSIERLKLLLAPRYPGLELSARHANVSHSHTGLSLAERLEIVRTELGNTLYEELLSSNADDIFIHRYVAALYEVE